MHAPRLLVSAAHKSSGKTTLTLGLCAALAERGLAVQPFKKGPDYIDPMWLAQASGRPCYNLDPHLMAGREIDTLFDRAAAGADISIVEGNKGLYDGLALDGSNSNAALACQLGLPVVLVIDARGMTRGIAPLILGYQAFEPRLRIAGVILNKLGGSRHEAKLRAVIEHYTDVRVLGAVQSDPRLEIAERHLGLVPSNEADAAHAHVATIRNIVASQVDLDAVLAVAHEAQPRSIAAAPSTRPRRGAALRIGIALDRAFGFYYPDDLEALRAAGATLVPIDTLHDTALPALDGLFLGGGFPEMLAPALAANQALREALRHAIVDGLPTYAECGGLMYLARSLTVDGVRHPMVGVIPGDVRMQARPVGRGYVELAATGDAPWSPFATEATRLRAHEFHYSSLDNLDPGLRYAYRVTRGHGIDGEHDGVLMHKLLASYTHLRNVGDCRWAERFVAFVRTERDARRRAARARPSAEQGAYA